MEYPIGGQHQYRYLLYNMTNSFIPSHVEDNVWWYSDQYHTTMACHYSLIYVGYMIIRLSTSPPPDPPPSPTITKDPPYMDDTPN